MIRRWLGAAFLAVAAINGHSAPLVDYPTDNRSLEKGDPQSFFMYVDRDFEGEISKPWQGGQYGFVRGPRRAGDAVIYTTLHEGVDIRPMRRDAQGNPLDEVRAAADGKVVHVSAEAGASNYGRYVVIEHIWDGSPYYTLYAHLSSIKAHVGDEVKQGEPIATMGFTGEGINRERAHVHFEVCMLWSENFDAWHAAHYTGSPNKHGIYNGMNLIGTDPARLLIEAEENPSLKISDYFASGEPFFKIAVKNSPNFSLIRRYPWLVPVGEIANPPGWVVTFSRHGVPLKVEASEAPVAFPTLTWVKDTPMAYSQATRGLIGGTKGAPKLTESGLKLARLLTWPD